MTRLGSRGWVSMLVGLLALGQGCGEQAANQAGQAAGKFAAGAGHDRQAVLARVGELTITEAQLQEELNSLPEVDRLRFASADRRQVFLKNLVRLEALAAEARRRGFDRDPDIVRRVKRTMVEGLLKQLRAKSVETNKLITEQEIEAYYRAQPGAKAAQLSEGELEHLRNRLLNEKRDQAVRKSIAELRARAKVEVDERNLARVQLDRQARPQPSSAPVRPD